jgi:hypothetical protein
MAAAEAAAPPGEPRRAEVDSRLVAPPAKNFAFWDAAEAHELEAYLARFHQQAIRYGSVPAFEENWRNAARALRHVAEHLRSVYEPVEEADPPHRTELKRLIREGRVLRAYAVAPPLAGVFVPRPQLCAAAPAPPASAARWLLGADELARLRAHHPLGGAERALVSELALAALRHAGESLDWQLKVVLDAATYIARFWARRWERPQRLAHDPRVLLAAAMSIAAKHEGIGGTTAKMVRRLIFALRRSNVLWTTSVEDVLSFEVELLKTIGFELSVLHVHSSVKQAARYAPVRVCETAWCLATEFYATDLIFEHTAADLAHAALAVAHAYHRVPPRAEAVPCTSPAAGAAALAAVLAWIRTRERDGSPREQQPADSPRVPGRLGAVDTARAIACVLRLSSGSSHGKKRLLIEAAETSSQRKKEAG